MKITHKKRTIAVVNTNSDLEFFIKEKSIYKFFKKIPEKFANEFEEKIKTTETLPFKQIKPWMKSTLKYPESIYQKNFLISMGWTDEETEEFIKQKQKKNSLILSCNKKNNPEEYYDKTPTRIEYWVKKGYDLESAKKKLSERQHTFSKRKCIDKYGEKNGEKKFLERQERWISTLKSNENYLSIQKRKNSYDYNIKKIDDLIERSSFIDKTKKIILSGFTYENLESFVDFVLESIDFKRYSDIHPFISSKLIQKNYNTSAEQIRDLFYSKTDLYSKNQTYGISVYHNKNRFKSIKEYEIALFLEENKIDYLYENFYPNKKFKYDFYLPRYDLYVEYFGMIDGKNMDKLNKIQNEYTQKMNKKIQYCEDNNLKIIGEINFKQLIKKLKQVI